MSPISLPTAQIVSLCMQSVFYGLWLASFVSCIRVLLFTGSGIRNRTFKALIVVACVMGGFATSEIAFSLRHVLDAFIFYKGPGGPLGQLVNISNRVNAMKTLNYVVQSLIADLMLIYRCFMVYQMRWIIIIAPIVIWLATAVVGSIIVYITFTLRIQATLGAQELIPFIDAGLGLLLAQNIITTSLIAWKIWSIYQQTAKYATSRAGGGSYTLRRALRIVIESGLLYTVSLLIFLAVYVAGSNANYIVSESIVMIIAIVFNLIIIRVHQGRTAEQTRTLTNGGSSYRGPTFSSFDSNAHASSRPSRRTLRQEGDLELKTPATEQGESFPLSPVEVKISRSTNTVMTV